MSRDDSIYFAYVTEFPNLLIDPFKLKYFIFF